MKRPILEQQLSRIDEIHQRLTLVLSDETLTGMEELVAELGSRLANVIEEVETNGDLELGADILSGLLERQRDLEQLLQARIKTTGDKLVGARQNNIVNSKYRFTSVKTDAELIKSMDLTG